MDAAEFLTFIERFKDNLKSSHPKAGTSFVNCIRNVSANGEVCVITVESAFDKSKVDAKANSIKEFADSYFRKDMKVSVELREPRNKGNTETEVEKPRVKNEKTTEETNPEKMKPKRGAERKSTLDPKFTFSSFVVGDNSLFAYNLCQAIARAPALNYNPCYIYGNVGLGKTHLAQAVGNEIEKKKGMNVLYMSCNTFIDDFGKAVGTNRVPEWKEKTFKSVDVLIIDDIQFLETKQGMQEAFFQIFNTLKDNNKQIICTSDRALQVFKNMEKRITTRIGGGVVVELGVPNLETRAAIIRKKCDALNFKIEENIIEFIAENVISNVRDIEQCITTLNAYRKLVSEKFTLDTAKEILKNEITMQENCDEIDPNIILECVSKFFKVSIPDIIGKKKMKSVVLPRDCAAYLMNKLSEMSTTEIGIILGGRDHSTIIHSKSKIEEAIKKDKTLKSKIEQLSETIKAEFLKNH